MTTPTTSLRLDLPPGAFTNVQGDLARFEPVRERIHRCLDRQSEQLRFLFELGYRIALAALVRDALLRSPAELGQTTARIQQAALGAKIPLEAIQGFLLSMGDPQKSDREFRLGIPAVTQRIHGLLESQESEATAVFISHCEEDGAIAQEIAAYLGRQGVTTWYYERDSIPGVKHLEQTGEQIDRCSVFVVILSAVALKSEYVFNELLRASEKSRRILPVLVGVTYDDIDQPANSKWSKAIGFAVASVWDGSESGLLKIYEGVKRGCG